jgi:hypothetical protein
VHSFFCWHCWCRLGLDSVPSRRTGCQRLAVVLPQHPDEHRPERPVLLAVDPGGSAIGRTGDSHSGTRMSLFQYLRVPVVTRDSGQGSCQGRYPQESAKIAVPTRIPQTVMKTSRRRATRSSFHPRNQGSSYIRAAGRVSSLARRDTDSAWRDTRTSPTALNSTTPAPTTTPSNIIARFSIGKPSVVMKPTKPKTQGSRAAHSSPWDVLVCR